MYEAEANSRTETAEQLPTAVMQAFGELREQIISRTVLPWSEHCTECVWPTCYTSCELFSPREDGRCRRFVDGMVRIETPNAVNPYILKIRFKQWGKLWTPGSLGLMPSEHARQMEHRDYCLGTMLYQLPVPWSVKKLAVGKRYGWKKRVASRGGSVAKPTTLMLECFNPYDEIVYLSLTIRSVLKGHKIPFQKLIRLSPGFNRVRTPMREITTVINLGSPFNIELIPNHLGGELTLYFGLMDFVEEAYRPVEKGAKVKCVVWDLDNTMWDGVLVEDGAENLVLKAGIRKVIETLDQRGILQSIASKNSRDETLEILKRHELDEYFLYPQISWSPKGEALKAIARQLNIGMDSILFVDDQEFERMQVESACVGVRTLDAGDYLALPAREDCQIVITEESANRRKLYQVEQERLEVQEEYREDYKAFLKHCNIRLTVTSLSDGNLERVHELTQRTNQMNFSGNRYHRDVLKDIMQNDNLDTYVLACEDRFGSYGIVGFGIVDRREPRLTDLMFSCRIQSKRVEHAFLGSIVDRYIAMTAKDFHANYKKTPRNEPSGQVFEDLGMTVTGAADGVTSLVFSRHNVVPNDGIIHVEIQGSTIAVVER